jgi:hypothetical protein
MPGLLPARFIRSASQSQTLRDTSTELRENSRSLQAESRKAQDNARAARTVSQGLARRKPRV